MTFPLFQGARAEQDPQERDRRSAEQREQEQRMAEQAQLEISVIMNPPPRCSLVKQLENQQKELQKEIDKRSEMLNEIYGQINRAKQKAKQSGAQLDSDAWIDLENKHKNKINQLRGENARDERLCSEDIPVEIRKVLLDYASALREHENLTRRKHEKITQREHEVVFL